MFVSPMPVAGYHVFTNFRNDSNISLLLCIAEYVLSLTYEIWHSLLTGPADDPVLRFDIWKLYQKAKFEWLKASEVMIILENYEENLISREPPNRPPGNSHVYD